MTMRKVVILLIILLCSTGVLAKKKELRSPFYNLDWVLMDHQEWPTLVEWVYGDKGRKKPGQRDGWIVGNISMGWQWIGIEDRWVTFKNEHDEIVRHDLWDTSARDELGSVVTDRQGHVIALTSRMKKGFDLNTLAQLPYLKYVNLASYEDIDLSKVTLPTSLEHIVFPANEKVLNLSRLSSLPNLKGLALHGVETDLNDILGLRDLSFLYLYSSRDLTDQNSPRYGYSVYSFSEQEILLKNLKGLVSARFDKIEFTNELLEVFAKNNPGLRSLFLNANGRVKKLDSLGFTKYIPQLETFEMGRSKLSTLASLSPLPDLTTLVISHNSLTDISQIVNSPKLKKIDFRYNHITDISPLDKLTELEWVNLFSNWFGEINGFSKASKLKYLDITLNNIQSTKGLDGARNLETLLVGDALIKKLEGISHMNKLRTLHVPYSSVKTIEGVPLNIENFWIFNKNGPYADFSKNMDPITFEISNKHERVGTIYSDMETYSGPIDISDFSKLKKLHDYYCYKCLMGERNTVLREKMLNQFYAIRDQVKKDETAGFKAEEARSRAVLRKHKSEWLASKKTPVLSAQGM